MKNLLLLILFYSLSNFVIAQGFEGRLVDVHYGFQLKEVSYCAFYDYKIHEQTKIDNKFINKLYGQYKESGFFESKNPDSTYLKILSMIVMDWNKQEVAAIRYLDSKSGGYKYYFSSDLPIRSDIEQILALSNEAFWQFYNSTIDPDYPIINELKEQTKDSDGNININKLAKIIRSNKSNLEVYLVE